MGGTSRARSAVVTVVCTASVVAAVAVAGSGPGRGPGAAGTTTAPARTTAPAGTTNPPAGTTTAPTGTTTAPAGTTTAPAGTTPARSPAPPPVPEATPPPAPTTAAPAPALTPAASPAVLDSARLPEPTGSVLWALTASGVVLRVELDTGQVTRFEPGTAPGIDALSGRGTTLPSAAGGVATGGDGVVEVAGGPLDGTAIALPRNATALAVTADALVVVAMPGGGAYVVRADGAATRVAPGLVLTADTTHVVTLACDDHLDCGVRVHDLGDGSARPAPAVVHPGEAWARVVLSPDAGALAAVAVTPAGVVVRLGDLHRGALVEVPIPAPSDLAFTVDGRWLLFGEGDHLAARPLAGGAAVEVSVPGLDATAPFVVTAA